MEIENQKYHLYQTFENLKGSARCVTAAQGKIVAGFLDKKLKIYQGVDNSYQFTQDVDFLDDYVYSLKIRSNGQIIAGCKDKNVYVLDEFGTPVTVLSGHTGPVNCVSLIDDNTAVSGSWDGTARVWDLIESKNIFQI